MNELISKTACEVADLLRAREISPVDAVTASAQRIEQVEASINAIPTVCIDRALEQAKALERQQPFGHSEFRDWLGGLPISVKDLTETAGVRTTFGSPI